MKDSTFEKYKLVVDEWFVNGFNGTKAYQKFYPEADEETAEANFRKILGNTRVSEYKQKKQEEVKEIIGTSHLELLSYLQTWAYSDITDTINLTPSQVKELPIEIRRLITEYEHTKYTDDNGNTTEKMKLKFVSKKDAIEMINKHVGFYEKDNKQKNGSLSDVERASLIAELEKKAKE